MRNLVEVDLEDFLSAVDVGRGHVDFLIEATRTDSGRVQTVLVVGRANDQDSIVLFEAVQFGEHLIDSGAGGGVLAAVAARGRQQRVNLVDKDDAWLLLARLREELTDAFGADTHVHLVKAGTSAVEEGDASLSSDGSG